MSTENTGVEVSLQGIRALNFRPVLRYCTQKWFVSFERFFSHGDWGVTAALGSDLGLSRWKPYP